MSLEHEIRRIGVPHTDKIEAYTAESEKEQCALEYVIGKHGNQTRKDGSLYITHLVAVASIVRGLGIRDEDVIAAALLHDVIEDTDATLPELTDKFGSKVARLVDGVSKFRTRDGKESDFETLRKVVQTSYLEPEVGIIKLADRLHNLRTLQFMSPEKQYAKAYETLMVYTGLAEAYGLWIVKTELEDLSFRYVDPENYEKVKQQIDSDRRLSEEFLEYHGSVLASVLHDLGVHGRVVPRLKGYYEADKKRNRGARKGLMSSQDFSDLNDIVSFRVILDDKQPEPYARLGKSALIHMVLGEIYETFEEQVEQSGFDDYLAHPQLNGYRALQATIRTDFGPFEVAIASNDMEGFNNLGLAWLMAKGQSNLSEYTLKIIFTPKGKMKFMSPKATGWDAAYAISPELGARAKALIVQVRDGETVNKYEINPAAEVPNGASVEVVVGEPTRAPKSDALHYVTPTTKKTIEKQLRMEERDKNVALGREEMAKLLSLRGLLTLEDLETLDPAAHFALLSNLGVLSRNELYCDVGAKHIPIQDVENELNRLMVTKEARGWSTMVFEGSDHPGVLAKLSTMISDLGLNIFVVRNSQNNGRYQVHLVIKGMNMELHRRLEDWLRQTQGCVESWRIY